MKTMRTLGLVAVLLLAGCGNSQTAGEMSGPIKTLLAGVGLSKKADQPTLAVMNPAQLAAIRTALEQGNTPVFHVAAANLNYVNLMTPYGDNAGVKTWSSTNSETMSLRDGMLVATRGFGIDLMSAKTPSIAQIAKGSGGSLRSYYYLDGADQPVRLDYTCVVSSGGTDSISVLGKTYATRKVVEACSGEYDSFDNAYWFDHGLHLRQSSQRVAPALGNLVMQRVVD